MAPSGGLGQARVAGTSAGGGLIARPWPLRSTASDVFARSIRGGRASASPSTTSSACWRTRAGPSTRATARRSLAALRALADRTRTCVRFVVGLPLHMSGGEGASRPRDARRLAQLVADATGRAVELWDERLTTVQAQRSLAASEVRGKKARAHIDEAAPARSSSRGSTRGRLDGSDDDEGAARRPGGGAKRKRRGARRHARRPAAGARRDPRRRPASLATAVAARSLGVAGRSPRRTWLFVLYPSERGPGQRPRRRVVDRAADPSGRPGWLRRSPARASSRARASSPSGCALTGGTGGVVAGTHLLTDDASPRELMARLERRARRATARVTFPEGWNRFDMARRLQDKQVVPLRDFLDATTDADPPPRARHRRRQRRGLPLPGDVRPALRQRRARRRAAHEARVRPPVGHPLARARGRA